MAMRGWSQMQRAVRCVLMLALIAVIPDLPAVGAEEDPVTEAKKKHQLAWWDSARPSKPTAASQLAYANGLRDAGRLMQASRQYRAITYAWPQSAEAPSAQYNYAQLLERRGKPSDAFVEYQYLLETYAGFVPYEEVLERQYVIADRLATEPRHFLVFSYHAPEEAIPLFETLIQNGPQWKRSAELQFRIARIYEKNEQYDLAMDSFALYQQKYPLSSLTESAAFDHGKCAYEYSCENPNAIELRQNAEAILQSFLERYPRSAMVVSARTYLKGLQMEQASILYQQALTYDRESRQVSGHKDVRTRLAAARISYQRIIDEYPLSRWAETARARISRIDQRMEQYREN